MYPQRRMSRQALELGLVALIVLTVSACGGGSGAKGRAAEEASKPELTTVAGDGGEHNSETAAPQRRPVCAGLTTLPSMPQETCTSRTGDILQRTRRPHRSEGEP